MYCLKHMEITDGHFILYYAHCMRELCICSCFQKPAPHCRHCVRAQIIVDGFIYAWLLIGKHPDFFF